MPDHHGPTKLEIDAAKAVAQISRSLRGCDPHIEREMLLRSIIFFTLSNFVLALLAVAGMILFFGGTFAVFGWIIIAIWIIWAWRGLRQIFRLLRAVQ